MLYRTVFYAQWIEKLQWNILSHLLCISRPQITAAVSAIKCIQLIPIEIKWVPHFLNQCRYVISPEKKTTQIIYSSFAACFPNSIPFDWTIMCWMILFMSIIQFMMIKIYTQHTWSVFLIVFMQINPFNPVFIRIIGMYILVGCPHHSVYCPKSNCFWFRFFCSNNVPHCR